jgi:hypothetical protein
VFFFLASNNSHELKRLEMPYKAGGSVETRFVDFDDPRKCEPLILGADVVIRSVGSIHSFSETC